MYLPALEVLLSELNLTQQQIADEASVAIPANLLRFLLQVALLESEFNEDGYLTANPDVRKAVEAGGIEDPRLHYVWTGYFEGRLGATPPVNEEWYLKAYPDVAAGIAAGTVASAAEHFATVGAKELRAPGPEFQDDAAHWGLLLRGVDKTAPLDPIDDAEAPSLSVWTPEPQL